jgi:hypothetical protein
MTNFNHPSHAIFYSHHSPIPTHGWGKCINIKKLWSNSCQIWYPRSNFSPFDLVCQSSWEKPLLTLMTRYTVRIYRYRTWFSVYTSGRSHPRESARSSALTSSIGAFCLLLVLYLDAAARARIFRIVAGEKLPQANAERVLLDTI